MSRRARNDERRRQFPAPQIRPAETAEEIIRAVERDAVRLLHVKPWTAGRSLEALVRYSRERHTASIARSNASRKAGTEFV